jgi:hypothetical protein
MECLEDCPLHTCFVSILSEPASIRYPDFLADPGLDPEVFDGQNLKTVRKKLILCLSKDATYFFLAYLKDLQAPREAFSPHVRSSSSFQNMKFFYFFLFVSVHPNPDSEKQRPH